MRNATLITLKTEQGYVEFSTFITNHFKPYTDQPLEAISKTKEITPNYRAYLPSQHVCRLWDCLAADRAVDHRSRKARITFRRHGMWVSVNHVSIKVSRDAHYLGPLPPLPFLWTGVWSRLHSPSARSFTPPRQLCHKYYQCVYLGRLYD